MHNLSNFKYKIWDDVMRPVGIVQLVVTPRHTESQYDKLAQFLNFNRYIVAQNLTTGNSFNHELMFGQCISQAFNKPLFFIGDKCNKEIVHHVIQQTNLYSGAISVAPTHPKSIWAMFHIKQPQHITNHIPLMIINGDNPIYKSWGKLGRNLHQMYGTYDADKLSVMIYPEISSDKILIDNNCIKNDILEFLCEQQHKK
ncbi:MAG: hypothetical protein IKB10_01250 [Alphaproteobacteria bacterium]|nr:hypothetical protein [Alphaproteobacteria bacterium]MBR6598027.1 hypothetical protein [Alphaproteobacteria bacterium]